MFEQIKKSIYIFKKKRIKHTTRSSVLPALKNNHQTFFNNINSNIQLCLEVQWWENLGNVLHILIKEKNLTFIMHDPWTTVLFLSLNS